MWFPLLPLYVSAAVVSSNGFWLQAPKPTCPPKEEVYPCTCVASKDVTMMCTGITEVSTLQNTFKRSSGWNVQNVHFEDCILDYIPSEVLGIKALKLMNISSSILVAMFDKIPKDTPKMEIFLYESRFRRGMQWEQYEKTNIESLGFFNVHFKYINEQFRDHMPTGMKNLWFSDSRTSYVAERAFGRLINLLVLVITGGSMKNISRDLFPRPSKIQLLNLSNQKLDSLPKDLFVDFPDLVVFYCQKNLLTTLDKDVFMKGNALRFLVEDNPVYCDCDMKWVATFKKKTETMIWGDCAGPESFKGKAIRNLTPKDFAFCN